jgi:uncharacterized protein (TIGR02145 family)
MKRTTILSISLPFFVLFYQCCKEPEEASKPTVITAQIEYDTAYPTIAKGGGAIKDNGGAPVTERGVCWNTWDNPSLSEYESYTLDGEGTGSFTSGLSVLKTNTTYYVRAYATNKKGTAYGNEVSFTTTGFDIEIPCKETPTVTDYDGNVYATVKINDQCWMAENLRSTHYADGAPIEDYYSVNFDESNDSVYGKLYTWYAAMDKNDISNINDYLQGICPQGWHIPSPKEKTKLQSHLGYYTPLGGKLKEKGTLHWKAPNKGSNNAIGYNALPAGYITDSIYYGLGKTAAYWTTGIDYNNNKGLCIKLTYDSENYTMEWYSFNYALSVRCIKDK